MPGAGFITMVFFLAVLALAAAFQPSWLPKSVRRVAIGIIAVIAILFTVIPSLSSDQTIPTWAVYLLAGISFIVLLGVTVFRWLFNRFVDNASQLREAINNGFKVLLEEENISITELKRRAENKAGEGIRFNKHIWKKALKIFEQEGILQREKLNE